MMTQLRQTWLFPMILLLGVLTGCASSPPMIARPDLPSPTAIPTVAVTATAQASPIPVGPLVVTVLATDLTLMTAPDDRSSSASARFTDNGRTIGTILYVSGDLPVLETDVVGVDGRTRWTRVRYQRHVGPQDGGTDVDTTGYLRNDLISAPHAPGTPAVRNPTMAP
jgi:hypothetical protein